MNVTALKLDMLHRLESGLPPALTYHALHHTLDVAEAAREIAALENITDPQGLALIESAALLHDSGFIEAYRNHEEGSCNIARRLLPGFGYSPEQVEHICDMVMATRIPQNPGDQLARVLCDADLDYLGREDYYPIADTLYRELLFHGILTTELQWVDMQIRFLESHNWWTATNLNRREKGKQLRLNELRVTREKLS